MLTLTRTADLAVHTGQLLGHSGWREITQDVVDDFVRITGDDQWIHTDPERAKALPGGRTLVHGLYLLSLVPVLQREIWAVEHRGRGLNYGYERVRFIEPVSTGSRVRLAQSLIAVTPHAQGTRLETSVAIKCEGLGRPAVTAHNILLIMNP
ncbi:MaoC family dehydratase [Pararhodobacter sp.]|uniref:MaoC family dehydratase n=1 Tax=Pararhodobacter sp. TaxID=2127056 RepID=UPI002FDD637D